MGEEFRHVEMSR